MPQRRETLEIDEQTRELRCGARVATPQPRVFDLIAYLSRHRERVVPKEELLENLWPGVLVTDASLQRAVSLARSTCAELGVADVIRTYARQGYRFRTAEASTSGEADAPADSAATVNQKLQEAREAYRTADWERASQAFQVVDNVDGLTAEDLQRWAHATQCAGRMPDAALPLERAVAAYAARGDACRAGWVAVLLSQMNFEYRDPLAAKGWLHRAARLLESCPESREAGYLNYLRARLGLASNELEPALAAARKAHELGRRHSDPDLEYLGLVYAGDIAVTLGRIEEGLALLDEAGAAVRSHNISPFVGSIIYCGVISISMVRADWERAAQWTALFEEWCGEHGAHSVPGLCRLHRAEVLNIRGELDDAHREVEQVREVLARRSRWIEGEAWRVLGEIHLGRGDMQAAETAFRRAHEQGWDPQPGFALLEMERGNIGQALRLITRSLEEQTWGVRQRRGLLLAHCAIIAARAGDSAVARTSLAELDATPQLWSTSALRALVTCARGELAALEGRVADAIAWTRSAIQQWHAIESPLSAARARCRLAGLLAAEGDAATAEMEWSAAAAAFERAGAKGPLARCREHVQRLAGKTSVP